MKDVWARPKLWQSVGLELGPPHCRAAYDVVDSGNLWTIKDYPQKAYTDVRRGRAGGYDTVFGQQSGTRNCAPESVSMVICCQVWQHHLWASWNEFRLRFSRSIFTTRLPAFSWLRAVRWPNFVDAVISFRVLWNKSFLAQVVSCGKTLYSGTGCLGRKLMSGY
jgi:hypothetical protein